MDDENLSPQHRASVALIERELARIPVGSTIRPQSEAPRSAPAPEESVWDGVVRPPPGEHACKKCEARVDFPGLCAECGMVQARIDAALEFAAARESIPEAYRWATADAKDMIPLLRIISSSRTIGRSPVHVMAEDIATAKIKMLTIIGPRSGASKSSLACAIVTTIVDHAVDSLLSYQRTHGASRMRVGWPEPRIVTLARGARFVPARDLADEDRGSGRSKWYAYALDATLLVLDDMGHEVSARDDSAWSAERARITGKLIEDRWDRGRPTIPTTYLDRAGIGKLYDGGTERRLFTDQMSAFVQISGGR